MCVYVVCLKVKTSKCFFSDIYEEMRQAQKCWEINKSGKKREGKTKAKNRKQKQKERERERKQRGAALPTDVANYFTPELSPCQRPKKIKKKKIVENEKVLQRK